MTPPAAAAAAAMPATSPAPARRGRPRRVAPAVRRPMPKAEVAGTLAPARFLDRLIRSRSWIALIAFALIGIVAMQLWLLKLNGGIGRAIEHEGYLQRENAALSAESSAMSAGDLVEQQAVAAGMMIVAPGKLIFLRTHGATDERMAAARLAQPVQAPSGAAASPTTATQSSTMSTEPSATSTQPSTTSTEPSTTSTQPSTTSTETPASTTTQPEAQG
jgi:hypothetical protein